MNPNPTIDPLTATPAPAGSIALYIFFELINMKRSPAQKKSSKFLLATMAGLLFGGGAPLLAATDVWNGGGAPDGSWSNPANWSGTAPNATGDSLIFSGSAQASTIN